MGPVMRCDILRLVLAVNIASRATSLGNTVTYYQNSWLKNLTGECHQIYSLIRKPVSQTCHVLSRWSTLEWICVP